MLVALTLVPHVCLPNVVKKEAVMFGYLHMKTWSGDTICEDNR